MKLKKLLLFLFVLFMFHASSFAQLAGLVGVRTVSPARGMAGQTVSITVTNVPLFATKIFFGTYEASCLPIQVLNLGGTLGLTPATRCTVPAGPAPGATVKVSIQNALTLQIGDTSDFTYTGEEPPEVSSLTPSSGYIGTSVKISVEKRPSSGTTVTFGGTVATCSPFAKDGNEKYSTTCNAPSGHTGTVDVALNNNGAVGEPKSFTYLTAPPRVKTLSPNSGYEATSVSVTVGLMPAPGTQVMFGLNSAVCAPFTASGSGYKSICSAPATSAVGDVNVFLTNNGQDGASLPFTYLPPPAVSSLSPVNGYAGSSVTVTVPSQPQLGTAIIFGNSVASCTSFIQSGAVYQAVCSAPSTEAGTINVFLRNGNIDGVSKTFTYLPPPAVTVLSPNAGYEGSAVTVTTTLLPQPGTTVQFGVNQAVCGSFVISGSVYQADCLAPAGTGVVRVALENAGVTGVGMNFAYQTPPGVTSLLPTQGYTDTMVTVTVPYLPKTGSTVIFNATAAVCTPFTASGGGSYQTTCAAPPGVSGNANVAVTDGVLTGSAQIYGYLVPVTPVNVTGVFPIQGYAGQSVMVTASAIPTADSKVYFGTELAVCTSFILDSGTYTSTCTAPQGTSGSSVTVTLQNTAGTGTGAIFTYAMLIPAPPAITNITPDRGYAGDIVTIMVGMAPSVDTQVYFDGTLAVCSAFSPSGMNFEAMCTVPVGTLGSTAVVKLSNLTGDGASSSFIYENLPADITSLSNYSGLAGDSVLVTVNAQPSSDAAVLFDTYTASCGSFSGGGSNYTATCAVPSGPGAGNSVDVKLTNKAGTGAAVNFAYNTPPPPALTTINPGSGYAGDSVIVTVASLPAAGTTVLFGTDTAVCGAFTSNGSGGYNAVCTVPVGPGPGNNVTVTLSDTGVVGSGISFAYSALPLPPAVSSINPSGGKAGDSVAVTVTSMPSAATTVSFGTDVATCGSFTSNGSGGYSALCTVPSGPSDGATVNVTLQNATGSGAGSNFTYTAVTVDTNPIVSSITPTQGWGGTEVTINGANLSGASVTFAGRTATCTQVSESQLVCIAPNPVAAGNAAIVVATPNGFTDGTMFFDYNLTDAPEPFAPNIVRRVYRGSVLALNLSADVLRGPVSSAAIQQNIPASEGTATLDNLIFTYTPSNTYEGTIVLDYTLTSIYGKLSNPATITLIVSAVRPDPTQDAEVKAMLEAQMTSAKRYITTQMTNFRSRLGQIRGQSDLRDDFRLNLGLKEAQDPEMLAYNSNSMNDLYAQNTQVARNNFEVSDAVKVFSNREAKDYGVWMGGAVHLGSEKQSADLDYTTVALSGGVDKLITDKLIAGIGIGFTHDKTDVGSNSDLTGNSYSLVLYSTYSLGKQFYLEGMVGYNYLEMDGKRQTIAGRASGTRNGDQVYGSLSAGYVYNKDAWEITPFTRLEAAWSGLKSYSESGADNMNLKYGHTNIKMLGLAFGVDSSLEFEKTWGSIIPRAGIEYLHNFEGNSKTYLGYADTDSTPYSFSGKAYSRDNITVGAGVDFSLKNDWAFACDYKIIKGDHNLDNSIAAQARYQF